MKLALVCIIAFLLSYLSAFSQESLYNSDSTVNESVIREYQIVQLEKIYDRKSKEYKVLKSAKTYYAFAQVFSSVGGALVGWPIGTHLGGGEANWNLAYAGLGTIGVAFAFAAISKSYIDESIDLYIISHNESLSQISNQFQGNFSFTSVGISIRF